MIPAVATWQSLRLAAAGLTVAVVFGVSGVHARITNIQMASQTPASGGASFGSVGAYENIVGVAFGEIDPDDPLNAVITDIDLAPRNARGAVEYSMDFSIFKPVDTSKGNHTLLYSTSSTAAA